MSPMGALEAAAAAMPVTAAPPAVPASFSLTMYPAAKYSSRYANNPWITSEMMMALGMVLFGSLVSAASAVQLSNPTRIRIASVDWTRTPLNVCGLTTSHAPLKDHAAACGGFAMRYQIARPLKKTRETSWMTLIQNAVRVEPVTPR